jgi:DNA-binding MarR family transcriptional regulator
MDDLIPQYSDKLGGAPHSKQSLRLWLRLLSCSTVVEKRIRAKLEAEFATTLPRFDLLATLNRRAEGVSMSELSASLMVSNGNVTGVVTRLINDKLVSRIANSSDRRSAIIRLTPQGRQAFAKLARVHEDWIDQMFSELSNKHVEQLMELLGRLRQSVESNLV